MSKLLDREALIKLKKEECEQKIAKLYLEFPRLQEIDTELGSLTWERIKVAVLNKDFEKVGVIDAQAAKLFEEKDLILKANSIPQSIYEPDWDCVHCQDRGYLSPGVLCTCYRQERLDYLFEQGGIIGNMREKSLDNFKTDYYHDPQAMEEKLQRCRIFIDNLAQGKKQNNLLFIGGVGRGKTHLSLAIANEAIKRGCTVIYYRVDDLLDDIRKYKFDADREPNDNDQKLNLLKETDLLIIDDLGVESVTSFAENQIKILVEDRNNLNKPWIINTNFNVDELQEKYGQRITDRIIEKSDIFSFVAPLSIREIIKRKALSSKN